MTCWRRLASATVTLTVTVTVMSPLLLHGGCGSPGAGAAQRDAGGCFLGDPSAAPEVQMITRAADGTVAEVPEGAALPLVQPPQGGKILLVGARARNLDGCPVIISAALRALDSDLVIAFERRPVRLEPTQDGWLAARQPDAPSNYANLPACPVAGLDHGVNGRPHILQLIIEDSSGRKAEATATIIPTCGEPGILARCQCECAAEYVLGQECP